ncbi:hypothetical protein RIF29_25405 [Crotalaria pallida]|uniref:ATP-dependent DNA ligase family profile domain-containing protein n=1 Tax=Crotalaria pallida TaxID=3830 RepID=A0AAN9ENP4_CROPI
MVSKFAPSSRSVPRPIDPCFTLKRAATTISLSAHLFSLGSHTHRLQRLLNKSTPFFQINKIVSALLTHGVWKLPKTCNFTPGVPVGSMLSKATKGVSEILNKFQDVKFTCEYKYDGERAQFPDVVAAVSRLKKSNVSSFVLDCELVAYDRAKKNILPFRVLSTRARKNVALNDIKVDVCIFSFDLLYLNGQALLQENLRIRREFATAITSNDVEEVQKFLHQAVDVRRLARFGTRFSEEMLEQQFASLRSRVIPKPKTYYRYAETINPDVWFETSEV